MKHYKIKKKTNEIRIKPCIRLKIIEPKKIKMPRIMFWNH